MYNSQTTAERIKKLLIDRHITGKQMSLDLGLGVNTLSNIKRGDVKSVETFSLIAEYLDCSVDYLIGRVEQKNIAAVPDQEDSGTQKLIENYYLLNENAQKELMNYLEYMITKPENLKQDEGKRAV